MADKSITGYLHPDYSQSLLDIGNPYFLEYCNGWILQRNIPQSANYDAMGCYPLFCCQDWSKLHLDLAQLEDVFVSLSIVTDPFGGYNFDVLKSTFKDIIFPFKEHFVVDLSLSPKVFVDKHHYRNVRKALREIDIKTNPFSSKVADDWSRLYSVLIDRHNIKGITAFSKSALTKQLQVPGTTVFQAEWQNQIIGMTIWYTHQDISYYHLGAYSEIGYQLKASFALFWTAIEYFADLGLEWLNLGAGAGIQNKQQDGLTRFKKGWSTGTRTAYFCGRIFQRDRYMQLMQAKGIQESSYFPAYRSNEYS